METISRGYVGVYIYVAPHIHLLKYDFGYFVRQSSSQTGLNRLLQVELWTLTGN